MRIAVTGASGFVGRHVVNALSESHELVALSRSPVDLPIGAENRVVPSIDSQTDWSGLLDDVDVVLHLAARVHVMTETSEDPLEEFREVNARGTERLAHACVQQGVKRLVFVSSIKVNGERSEGRPLTSEDLPTPVDPYGISKFEGEQALKALSDTRNLEVVIVRPPVVYGPGVKGNIERLARLTKVGLPLPFGSIQNRRTMLSISNMVEWLTAAMESEHVPPRPLLIGDPSPISTRDLVKWLAEGQGRRVRQLPVPIEIMRFFGRLAGKQDMIDRLIGDLELRPDFEQFPGVLGKLETPHEGVVRVG
ncbi:NAD-dependent epimerase/dehydratase family protein [Flaviflexus salsibiostraticola]|uniref:NAD-dependent epimerase/dehydratase family protein n=1 Tax=Flaviflexus salsibiostraticola TaxID=1282737 RepID=A0A3Q8WSR8_9ACTO|nr:NAD-dependent epimerase/dehydratase family protein [Flaviflexus salsibiostraticola]AZN29224.1 NAD-dependent epimerase/dehydratase family protein [Flaviflexus salsibiostraticola]